MSKIALATAVLMSAHVAYALNNSDLIQLSMQMSRQQQEQKTDAAQIRERTEQAGLRMGKYLQGQTARRQEGQLRQKQYLQELLWEWQRRQDARESGEQKVRDRLMERQQQPSGLFQ